MSQKCLKENIRRKSCLSRKKIQGSITGFLKFQPPESVLRNKDSLKQGKLELFFKVKTANTSQKESSLNEQSLKRPLTDVEDVATKKIKLASLSSVASDDIYTVEDSQSDEYFTAPSGETSEMSSEDEIINVSLAYEGTAEQESSAKTVKNEILEDETDKGNFNKNSDMDEKNDVSCDLLNNSTFSETKKQFLENYHLNDFNVDSAEISHTSCDGFSNNVLPCIDEYVVRDKCTNTTKEFELTNQITGNNYEFQDASDKRTHSLYNVRCQVTKVCEEQSNQGYLIKRLSVKNKYRCFEIEVTDSWADVAIAEGDILNFITTDHDAKNSCKVDMQDNILVMHPDCLVSGTTVSNALGCLRRAVLSELFKNTEVVDTDNVSNVMLIGTVVHAIFQEALQYKKSLNHEELRNLAQDIMKSKRYLQDLIAVSSTPQSVLEEVEQYLPRIATWLNEFRRDAITQSVGKITMFLPNGNSSNQKTKTFPANLSMTQLLDIEENVWSPRLGLKGKIDATGRFKIRNSNNKTEIETILPIELKTGRESHSMEHHIQVAIYSMFCDERRNNDFYPVGSLPAGLLLYLKSGKTSCVPLKRTDECGIFGLRNQIAHFLTKIVNQTGEVPDSSKHSYSLSLPHPISDSRVCGRCPQIRNCSILSSTAKRFSHTNVNPSDNLNNLMSQHVSHLNEDDLAYFHHWMICVLLEGNEATRKDKQLRFWSEPPKHRSLKGQCITNLVLAGGPVEVEGTWNYRQTFKRSADGSTDKIVLESGDMVLISGAEPEYLAMATGSIHKITKDFVTMYTNRDFRAYDVGMTYSIDRHVWLSRISVQSSLTNLSMLMSDFPQCNRLRSLIISHSDPSFQASLDFIPRSSKDAVSSMLRGLNRTQRQAIKRVLLSRDYTLIVGTPGSGKTTTIVAMVRILLLCGLRVLLTSYTHSAVDNILIKLLRYKVKFLRLGKTSQVHPTVCPLTDEHLSRDFSNTNELRDLYEGARVVGCTCLAVTSHVFFSVPGQARPMFDVCIVDEASQISQPVCLAPLMHAKRFVLVGDHQQLPPLVVSREAKIIGADESLFRRLTSSESAVCELTLQYRMNSGIMGICNHATYGGRLECAHPSVATATASLDRFDGMKTYLSGSDDWILKSLDPTKSVVFLDTTERISKNDILENGTVNKFESLIVKSLTEWFVKAGCPGNRIGVIAPFRNQVKLLESEIAKIDLSCVEVNTVDKYQGRDKSIIILSFVKSQRNLEDSTLAKEELLNDSRRLNVAVTRAKHKLVMVGCARFLKQYEPCKILIDYLTKEKMIMLL